MAQLDSSQPATLLIRCSQQRAVHEAVRLLLEQCALDATVRLVVDRSPDAPGIGVHLENSTRWMCILRDANDVQTSRWALANGAWSLASLEGPLGQFEDATRALLEGNPQYLPISFARLMANGQPGKPASARPTSPQPVSAQPLTARECEVLDSLSKGLSNAEIAAELSISVHTVRAHLSSMAMKFNAANRLKLVAKATQLGYLRAGAGK